MALEIVWLGLVCLLAPAIAQYAGVKKKMDKGLGWVAVAGLMFILAGAFDASVVTFWATSDLGSVADGGLYLFQIIGWIFVLVGVISAAFEYFKK